MQIKRDIICKIITVGKTQDGVIWYLSKPAWNSDDISVTSIITQALQIDPNSDIFNSWIDNIKNSNKCYNPTIISMEQNVTFNFDETLIEPFFGSSEHDCSIITPHLISEAILNSI
ncbi:MAG: hypothetical protein ACRCXT_00915 [Paraclostridium sp.]